MQQFAINVLEHAAIHAANESLQNLTASTNFYQVGVVRFQHDITEMFLVVLHLLITYWTTIFYKVYVNGNVMREVQLNQKIDYSN